jgi:O-antigen/teichoic acid export membrane protein
MSRTEKAAKGFATGIFQYAVQILVQVFLAPVVLEFAGREALGAYGAISQVLLLFGLIDVVHSWSLERFFGQSVGLEDGGKRFRNVFATARTLLLATNSIFAILVMVLGNYVGPLFSLSPAIATEATKALWVIAAWSVIRTPLAAYANALVATQNVALAYLIGAFLGVLRAVASLGFVLLGGGLFGLILAGTVAEAIGSLLYRSRFKRLHPTLMPRWGFPDKTLIREIVSFGMHAVFLNIGNMLIFSSGNLLAGLTNGAAVASTFYTTQTPTMTAYNMLARLSDSATPAINELWGRRELERLRLSLTRLVRLLLLMTLPLATGVVIYNRELVTCWVGARQYAGTLLTVSLALFCIIVGLQRIAMVYAFVFGWMRLLTTTALLQGLANFGLGFYFGRTLGVGGITLALLITVLPQSVILWYKIDRFLDVRIPALLAKSTLSAAAPLAAAVASSLLIPSIIPMGNHTLVKLFTEIATFLAAYGAVAYPVSLADQDRQDLRRYATSLLHRLRIPHAPTAI